MRTRSVLRGLSLMELMAVMGLSGVCLALMSNLLLPALLSQTREGARAEILRRLTLALEVLQRDLRSTSRRAVSLDGQGRLALCQQVGVSPDAQPVWENGFVLFAASEGQLLRNQITLGPGTVSSAPLPAAADLVNLAGQPAFCRTLAQGVTIFQPQWQGRGISILIRVEMGDYNVEQRDSFFPGSDP